MMKRKFRVDIVLIFTIMMLVTVLGIIIVIYSHNKTMALDKAGERFKYAAEMFIEKSDNYIATAQLATTITSQLFNDPNIQLKVDSEQALSLLRILQDYRQLASISFVNEQGTMLEVSRQKKNSYIKLLQTLNDKTTVTYNYYDAGLNLSTHKVSTMAGSDPRRQAWYITVKQSRKLFWSKPTALQPNGQLGVKLAIPVFDSAAILVGVIKADILLIGLADFLKAIKPGRYGVAFVTDERGKLLLFTDSNKSTTILTNGDALTGLKLPEIGKRALQAKQNRPEDCFSFAATGEQYLGTCQPFSASFDKPWMLTIIVPEKEFTGALQMTLRRILYLSFVALIVGIIISILLARRISKPIELIAADVLKIRNFDLDSELVIKSQIHEVQSMYNAIQAMKNSLKAFRLYLPSELVKQLIASGENIAIGGREKELTLFFSDIAQFTSIAEQYEPHNLMLQLSEYFDSITTVIDQQQGTVDKFIGDAVMAFWGAPLPNSEHPAGACRAALLCQQKISELNRHWQAVGKEPFFTRIGIHTSPVIVGNIGARQRMNYTVLGDGVNLASRLEGANKLYHTKIIISQTTYNLVKESFICRILDRIAVKGKNNSIEIYELLAEHCADESGRLRQFANEFQSVYNLYQQRQWTAALKILAELIKLYPDDFTCKLYIKRCENYLDHEPGDNWDGISRLKTK
jgi:adenylate cyclase